MASWIIFICLLITLSLIPWKMNQNKKGFPFFRFQVFKSKRFYGTVLHNKISWLSSQINKSWSTLSLSWSSFSSGVSYSLVSFTFQRFHRTFNEFSQIFLQTGARLGSDIAVTNVNVARFFTFSELLSLNARGLGRYAEKFLFLYWKDDTRCVERDLIKISFCSARPKPQWPAL